MDEPVSEATVGRLPAYLRSLVDLAGQDVPSVSSSRLARLVGVNPATLRRDLASLEITGTRGVGYDVKYLLFEISVVLGGNQEWPVAVVGAGNLGRALTNYQGLASRGFPVRVLFDIDPELVGTEISGLTVEHFDRLDELVAERGITVGVIATGVEAAQGVADRLVDAGVTSILNFTADPLKVPEHVVVRRVDLATELQILSFYKRRDTAVSGGAGLPLGEE
jgi:redox-sensing transcriptional repressor